MEETEEGAKVVEDIQFDNLSIVPSGASPSNTLEMGEAEELSVAALSEHVSALQEEEDSEEEEEEVEAGDYVQWGENYGIVLTMPEDGEVEVDLYEESDGTWRSTGETEMVSIDSLEEWDVEDDSIGAAEEEESEEDMEEDSEEDMEEDEEEAEPQVPEEHRYESREEAESAAEEMGIEGAHEMEFDGETYYVPGESHDDYTDVVSSQSKHGDDEDMDDDESEMQRGPHRETMDLLEDFMTADAHDETTAVRDFVEWADSEAVNTAVNQFSQIDRYSGDSNIRDFRTWVEAVLNIPQGASEEEMQEGAEDALTSDHERAEGADESRNPDGRFDDEYTEEASEEVSGDSVEESADEGSKESDVEELQEWDFHEPTWDGTTESEWDSPDMEDFDTDDLGEIAAHFLISQTGFPPENFTDLALPIVEPNGDLNVNALSAVKGGRGVSAVEGLPSEMEDEIVDYVNNLASEHFDKDWEENGITSKDVPSDDAEPTHKMDPDVEDDEETEMKDPIGASLDLINTFLRINGRDERESVDKMLGWLFSSTDIPTMKIESFRTAANAFLDQQGGADSFDAVDVESFRDWLLTQGGQTNDGTNARPTAGGGVPRIATPVHVLSGDDLRSGASKKGDTLKLIEVTNTMTSNIEEELEDLDEPVAVEKEEIEELQEKADRMDEMSDTLASLKERTDVLDSVDSDKVEQLAESDDPVVLESEEYDELSAEAEQVKGVYAEALSSEGPFSADDLVDKFSIEELREKYEEAGHDLEEELEAEPRSGDVDEEELEERAEEENKSEEELEQNEQIESKQAELREKILGGN